MTTIIKAIMSGMTAATVFAVVGTSASVAFSPKDLGNLTPTVQAAQQLDKSQAVQLAVWSEQDQQRFWAEEGDRGG